MQSFFIYQTTTSRSTTSSESNTTVLMLNLMTLLARPLTQIHFLTLEPQLDSSRLKRKRRAFHRLPSLSRSRASPIGEAALLTDQVGEEEVVHLLSDEGHGQQAADHQGKVLRRRTGDGENVSQHTVPSAI